jgi:isopentenyl diphosphate isomerase/L-lactate dehydrogenase-like FMN-dependent dehydrogenase
MPVITNIEDLRVLAKKRVPRMFYDYADSGSWTESTYRANQDDFAKIKLRQRVAVNMENRSTATTMVGQAVKLPVAIAPVNSGTLRRGDAVARARGRAKSGLHHFAIQSGDASIGERKLRVSASGIRPNASTQPAARSGSLDPRGLFASEWRLR